MVASRQCAARRMKCLRLSLLLLALCATFAAASLLRENDLGNNDKNNNDNASNDSSNDYDNDEESIPLLRTQTSFSHDAFSWQDESQNVASKALLLLTRAWMARDEPLEASRGLVSSRRALQEEGAAEQEGAFEELNALLEGTTVLLPDATINDRVAWVALKIDIRNLRCTNIRIDDLFLEYTFIDDQTYHLQINIVGLDLDCFLDYYLTWGLVRGSGGVEMYSDDNTASITYVFTSPNFREHPPTTSTVGPCSSEIRVSRIEFPDDGVVNRLLDTFKRTVSNVVETEVAAALCGELGSIGANFATDLLASLAQQIEVYRTPLPPSRTDPLFPESLLELPDPSSSTVLFDFLRANETVGGWFQDALDMADESLGSLVNDPDSPTGTGQDLGINRLLRASILNEEGYYIVPVSEWPDSFANGGQLFEGHDMVTQTVIDLDEVRVKYLDSFKRFDTLVALSPYTLQNHLHWDQLQVEISLTITMKASSLSDSVIVDENAEVQVEKTVISFGLQNVEADLAVLLAVNQTKLGDLGLGNLLDVTQITPCLLSALYAAEISGLGLQVGNVDHPSITGFVSVGVGQVLTDASEAIFDMYEPVLLDVAPNFFETTLRDILNEVLTEFIADNSDCPSNSQADDASSSSFLDVRDLLLPAEDAEWYGGSGDSPYGTFVPAVFQLFKDQLLAPNPGEETPRINSVLIGPLTEAQSNVTGSLSFSSPLLQGSRTIDQDGFFAGLLDRFQWKIDNLWIDHLDSFRRPLTILSPTPQLPHSLFNEINMGDDADAKPLRVSMRLSIEIEDDDLSDSRFSLAMKNELQVSVELGSLQVLLGLLAKISQSKALGFPLRHVLLWPCWLATIPAPELDDKGHRVSVDDVYAKLSSLVLNPGSSNLKLDVSCISCTTQGLNELGPLLEIVEQTGVMSALSTAIFAALESLAMSEALQTKLDRLLAEAPKQCPHDSKYVADYTATPYEATSVLSDVSKEVVEFALLVGTVGVNAIAAVAAETNFTSSAATTTARTTTRPPLRNWQEEGAKVVDFDKLQQSSDGLVDRVLDAANGYLCEASDGELGVNSLLQSLLLEEDGRLAIPTSAWNVSLGGIDISVEALHVKGLDSFTQCALVNITGPQTVASSLQLDHASLEVVIGINDASATATTTSETLTLQFGLKGLNVEAEVFAAVDEDRLQELPLGFLLDTDALPDCLASVVRSLGLDKLSVTVQDLEPITLSGYVSQEIENAITSAANAIMAEYKSSVLGGLSKLFDMTMLSLFNGFLEDFVKDKTCTVPLPSSEGIVDFRDMFWSASEAAAAGARGTAPYGTLLSETKGLLDRQLLANDETGQPKLNALLLTPWTKAQSDVEGTLQFSGDLVRVEQTDLNFDSLRSFSFRAFDSTFENIDTLGSPLKLLEPRASNGHVLDNEIRLGTESDPLGAMTKLQLKTDGDSIFGMDNEMEVRIGGISMQVLASLLAKVREDRLFQMPLGAILSLQCWLATIQLPSEEEDRTLGLEDLRVTLSEIELDAKCVSCTTAGLDMLPEILDALSKSGTTSLIQPLFVDFVVRLLQSDVVWGHVDSWLADAHAQCHQSTTFTPNIDASPAKIYAPGGQFQITTDDVEFLLFGGAVLAEAVVVVAAETCRQLDATEPEEFSADVELLNLEELAGMFEGLGERVLTEANGFLCRTREGWVGGSLLRTPSELGITGLLQYILDDAGVLDIATNLVLEFGGARFDLTRVRIYGLDSISACNLLEVTGPHTLQNSLSLDEIKLELALEIAVNGTTTNMSYQFGVSDVSMNVGLFLGIDQQKLEDVNIGSFLLSESALSCLGSMLHTVAMTELSLEFEDITPISVTGLSSEVFQDAMGNSSEAFLDDFKDSLFEGVPKALDVIVRPLLNELIEDFLSTAREESCPEPPAATGAVDFRDLLWEPEAAEARGGSGSSPYGDVIPLLKRLLDRELVETDPSDGRPRLNSVLIRPFTKAQSNIEGTLLFSGPIASYESGDLEVAGIDNFAIRVSDVIFENLDSLASPLKLLEPTPSNGGIVENDINFEGQRPVQGAIRLQLELAGNSSLQMNNDLDVRFDLTSLSLFASLFAMIRADRLLEFPLKDVFDVHCWLATMESTGKSSGGAFNSTLAIETFRLATEDVGLGAECISCSTLGLTKLPELVATLKEVGTIQELLSYAVEFGTRLVEGDFLQAYMDKAIADAPKQCRHSPGYEPDFNATDLVPSFPSLTRDDTEVLVFAGVVLLEVAGIIAAETQAQQENPVSDPLSAQKSLVIPRDMTLLDFSKLDDLLGDWANGAIDTVNSFLSTPVNADGEPINTEVMDTTAGRTDLRINSLLRETILDSDGALRFAPDLSIGGFTLGEIRVLGIDTVNFVEAIKVIGPQTLQSQISWEELALEVDMYLETHEGVVESPVESIARNGGIFNTPMTLSFGVENVTASAALLLALDQDRIGDLTLGSVLDMRDLLPCLLSIVQAAQVSQLGVSVGGIKPPSVTGMGKEISQALENASSRLFADYEQLLQEGVSGIFDVTVRGVLNDVIRGFLNKEARCRHDESFSSDGLVDFRELLATPPKARTLGASGSGPYGTTLSALIKAFNDEILGKNREDGLSRVNDLIGPFTKMQSGSEGLIRFPGSLLDVNTRVEVGGLRAKVEFGLADIRIENLDTVVSPVEVLVPIDGDPHSVNNTAAFGADETSLRLSAKIVVAIEKDDGPPLRNELDVSVDLGAANLVLQALLEVSEEHLMDFRLRDFLNADCWLATIPAPAMTVFGIRQDGIPPSLAVEDLMISVNELKLAVDCISCTSPGFEEFNSRLSSPEGVQDSTLVTNRVVNFLSDLLAGNFLQVQIDRMLDDAARRCPHRSEYDVNAQPVKYQALQAVKPPKEDKGFFFVVIGATLALVATTFFILIIVNLVKRRRHRRWLTTLPNDELFHVYDKQIHQEKSQKVLNDMTSSLARSSSIPLIVRIAIPIIILGNIGLFLSGHLNLGATVNIEVLLAGQKVNFANFFEFSMAKSIKQVYDAGAEELALMLVVFSVIWPYTKQVLTLLLWFAPPKWIPVDRRGSTFLWLDALGKWSMVDIFVLVVTVVSFNVKISSPNDLSFLPEEFYYVRLLVVPMWGLYANMIAQLVSQVNSHVIIHYHRKVLRDASPPEESEEKEALCRHEFKVASSKTNKRLRVRSRVNMVVTAFALVVVLLIILGFIFTSFTLDVLGILGIAVESGQNFNQAVSNLNVFDVVRTIFEQAYFLDTPNDYVGLGTLTTLLLSSVLIVPILQTLALLRQWFVPMNDRQRKRNLVLVEILQAWEYIEVYCLSVLIAGWQIGDVSEFMVNDFCGELQPTFTSMVNYGLISNSDAQCFKVEATVKEGIYTLICAAISLAILHSFIIKAAEQLESDRLPDVVSTQDIQDLAVEDYYDNRSCGTLQIRVPPTRFTDIYRYCLIKVVTPVVEVREDVMGDIAPYAESEVSEMKDYIGDSSDGDLISMSTYDNHSYLGDMVRPGARVPYGDDEDANPQQLPVAYTISARTMSENGSPMFSRRSMDYSSDGTEDLPPTLSGYDSEGSQALPPSVAYESYDEDELAMPVAA